MSCRPDQYAILHLESGEITGIDEVLNAPDSRNPTPDLRHHPIGFLTDTGLVTQATHGRRTHLFYLDLMTGYPHHLLDLPYAGAGLDFSVQLAAAVVQNDPATLGAPNS